MSTVGPEASIRIKAANSVGLAPLFTDFGGGIDWFVLLRTAQIREKTVRDGSTTARALSILVQLVQKVTSA